MNFNDYNFMNIVFAENECLKEENAKLEAENEKLREALEEIKGYSCSISNAGSPDKIAYSYVRGYNNAIKQVTDEVIDAALQKAGAK